MSNVEAPATILSLSSKEICEKFFPNLITISRFDKRKGHEKVIMAVRNLREKFPKIKYICIGFGDEEKNLKKLVNQLSLDENVIFLSDISFKYKSDLLKKSHLFVMPSIIYKKSVEGFGISFIEAAQHSVPSIGGKDGGEADAIKHQKTGLICDGNNLNSVYQSIEYMFEKDRYLEYGKNAKEFSKKFDWNLIVKKYIELLNKDSFSEILLKTSFADNSFKLFFVIVLKFSVSMLTFSGVVW